MPTSPPLDDSAFLQVVAATPLVSLDLIVVRGGAEVLLGRRSNRPARGFWFVPGGRIRKNETMAAALRRVAQQELGLGAALDEGRLPLRCLGAFEHFYDDCFAGDVGVSTHYVALGQRLDVAADFALPRADAQHAELRWWPLDAALAATEVHRFTQDYLRAIVAAAPAGGSE